MRIVLPRRPAYVSLLLAGGICLLLALCFRLQLALTAQLTFVWRTYYWLAALGTLAGGLLAIGIGATATPHPWIATPALPRLPRQYYQLAAAAAVCASIAAWCVHRDIVMHTPWSPGAPPWMAHGNTLATIATLWWAAGLLLLLLSAAGPRGVVTLRALPATSRQWPAALRARKLEQPTLLLLGIIALAAALRLPNLDAIPTFVHYDEAQNGMAARFVAQGKAHSLFSYAFASLPLLGYVWDGLFLKLFGDSLFMLRLSSVVLGLGSIALVALLGKELFNRRTGLLAAALLTLFHIHIHYSRAGHHYIQALFAVTLTLYLLIRALRYGSRLAAVGTGLALSADLQVYFAGRIVFLVVPLVAAFVLMVGERQMLRARIPVLYWILAAFLVSAAPIIVLIAEHYAVFAVRTRQVLIVGGMPEVRPQMYSLYGSHDMPYILRKQLSMVLRTFNYLSDTSLSYRSAQPGPAPMLDSVSAALLPAAVAYACCRLERAGFALCLITLGCGIVVGGVLTIQAPYWPRLIAVVPILALLIGALLDGLWQLLESLPRCKPSATIAALALVASIGYGNYQWYFNQYSPAVRDSGLAMPTDVGLYLRGIHDHPYAYGVTDPRTINIDTPAVNFLAPDATICPVLLKPVPHFPTCWMPRRHDRVFVLTPQYRWFEPALKRLFPGGTLRRLHTYSGGSYLDVYRVQG